MNGLKDSVSISLSCRNDILLCLKSQYSDIYSISDPVCLLGPRFNKDILNIIYKFVI